MLPERQRLIAEKIKENGFLLEHFNFQPVADSTDQFDLHYRLQDPYFFSISKDGKFRYSPASDGRMSTEGQYTNWAQGLKQMDNWLRFLKQNVTIENPWERISGAGDPHLSSNNEQPFTAEEERIIQQQLDQMLEMLQRYATDLERIREDIDYLKQSGKRVSKKDMGLMIAGNILGWITSSVIPPQAGQEVMKEVGHIFSEGVQNMLQ